MPRTNRPRGRHNHPRAHVRAQAQRYAQRRWTDAKNRYGDYWFTSTRVWVEDANGRQIDHSQRCAPYFTHPEDARKDPGAAQLWVFAKSMNEYSRNFHTYCSCAGCSGEIYSDMPRSAARLNWMRDWADEMEAEAPTPGRTRLGARSDIRRTY